MDISYRLSFRGCGGHLPPLVKFAPFLIYRHMCFQSPPPQDFSYVPLVNFSEIIPDVVYRWVFGCSPVVGQPSLRGRGRREGRGSGRALGGRGCCHHLWNGLIGMMFASSCGHIHVHCTCGKTDGM